MNAALSRCKLLFLAVVSYGKEQKALFPPIPFSHQHQPLPFPPLPRPPSLPPTPTPPLSPPPSPEKRKKRPLATAPKAHGKRRPITQRKLPLRRRWLLLVSTRHKIRKKPKLQSVGSPISRRLYRTYYLGKAKIQRCFQLLVV